MIFTRIYYSSTCRARFEIPASESKKLSKSGSESGMRFEFRFRTLSTSSSYISNMYDCIYILVKVVFRHNGPMGLSVSMSRVMPQKSRYGLICSSFTVWYFFRQPLRDSKPLKFWRGRLQQGNEPLTTSFGW